MLILLTISSLLLALIMTVIAWRALHAESERSAARVEALARDIHQPAIVDELPLRATAIGSAPADATPARTAELFAVSTSPAAAESRWGLAIAVSAFVVASVAAIVIVLGGDAPGSRIAMASATGQAESVRRPNAVPLELVALSHDRDGNQLTVRGIVRNPATGIQMDRLTAVIVLFNMDGSVVATVRTPVVSQVLIAGGESTFAVTIPDASAVARYRVSFRSDERVVAHLDKRTAP